MQGNKMKIDSKIKNVQAQIKGNILVIKSTTPLRILSSAIFNGGLTDANAVLNIQVPEGSGSKKNDFHWNPENFLIEQVQKLHLQKDTTVALMTAAKMHNLAVCTEKCGETAITVFATAGKTVAVTAGEPAASRLGQKIGTINIILLVDGNLTDGCMVETIKTMTEAKTVALRELDLRSQFSGDLATGTLTDSVLVGCTKRGAVIQYAGTFTLLGELIGKCVRESVKTALYKQERLSSGRSMLDRLNERGISPEKIMLLKPGFQNLSEDAKKQFQEQLETILSDKRICSLVAASLRLDEDYGKGLIPECTTDKIGQTEIEDILLTALRGRFNEDKSLDSNKSAMPSGLTSLGKNTKSLLLAILKRITPSTK
jgi:adenosylcobinamide hydrolase